MAESWETEQWEGGETDAAAPVPDTSSAGNSQDGGSEWKREVFELVKMVLLFLLVFWGLKTFVVEGYEVQGESMAPTLEDGERILVFKLSHQLSQFPLFSSFEPVDESDIIVLESPVETGKRYIKRVIAKGPKVTLDNTVDAESHHAGEDHESVPVLFSRGRVYVNNHLVEEEQYLSQSESHLADSYEQVEVLPGQYYVLGDHRSVSRDSRSFGPVSDDRIIGKAVFRFWPLSRLGPL